MILELRNININKDSKNIINDFSYTFVSGNSYLLLGENGSGKTTLLKYISCMTKSTKGKLLLDGVEIKNNKQYKYYRNRISLLINSSSSLFPNLTIIQNIKFFLGLNNITYTTVSKHAIELLEAFHLVEYKNKTISVLSKGMQQKVALVIAFLKDKDIILLDEPYDGLDTSAIQMLKKLIINNLPQKIIIMTSPNLIDEVCTEVIQIGG